MYRTMMQAYVHGSNEAVALYLKAFDASLGFNVKSDDDTYYHAEIDISGNVLAIAEAHEDKEHRMTGNTMQFCLHYGAEHEDKVIRAYEVMKEGSQILFPLGPCDFSPLMTDFIDKYGVRWCIFV